MSGFKSWSPEMVAAHNKRIAEKHVVPPVGKPLVEVRSPPPAKALNRAMTDEERLNKTEKRFLARLRMLGYRYIGVQVIALKLADDTRYHPDFVVIDQNDHVVVFEVKGFLREDSYVKIKVAARQFPWMRFVLVYWKNNQFEEHEIKP